MRAVLTLMLGALGAAMSVGPVPDEWRWPAFLAFVVLTAGLLSLEAVRDRHARKNQLRIELDAELRDREQEARFNAMRRRLEDVHARVSATIDSGSLKDRTIHLALELQNFALDRDDAEKAVAANCVVGRAALKRTYDEYKQTYGARLADIERELGAAGVMTGTVEDHIRPTVIAWEDPPGSLHDPFYNTDEWNMGPRSVDAIAGFLWERAADL